MNKNLKLFTFNCHIVGLIHTSCRSYVEQTDKSVV